MEVRLNQRLSSLSGDSHQALKHNAIPPLQRAKGEFSFSIEFCFWIIVSLSFIHQHTWLKSLQKKTFKSKLFTSAKKKYGQTCRDRRDQVEKQNTI